MTFAGIEDRNAIAAEMPWEDRDVATTLYGLLSNTAQKFPDNNAVSYQIFSGPKDKAETLSWRELHGRVTQAANLFRSLGVGEKDVVAYVLPNCNETTITLLGGAVAGIVSPINPLLDAEQIGAILREVGASVVVTLRPFPKTAVAPDPAARSVACEPDCGSGPRVMKMSARAGKHITLEGQEKDDRTAGLARMTMILQYQPPISYRATPSPTPSSRMASSCVPMTMWSPTRRSRTRPGVPASTWTMIPASVSAGACRRPSRGITPICCM